MPNEGIVQFRDLVLRSIGVEGFFIGLSLFNEFIIFMRITYGRLWKIFIIIIGRQMLVIEQLFFVF